ncbi:hypothetical protein MMC13_007004 [Lambiella insularis]|nr:hypothetical protein [Lambiella insularis]
MPGWRDVLPKGNYTYSLLSSGEVPSSGKVPSLVPPKLIFALLIMPSSCVAFLFVLVLLSTCVKSDEQLLPCADAFYYASRYTCYDSTFLCPVLNGTPTLRCGEDCFLPDMYSCAGGHLVYPPISSTSSATPAAPTVPGNEVPTCSAAATTQHLSDPPYDNFFYSDCHVDAQVVVTSPGPRDNLTIIGPRLIVAWPAGNSGVCAFFAPQSGINGSLGIELANFSSGATLQPVFKNANTSGAYPSVGVSGIINFNVSARLTVPILGSVRTIRDFTEGPSLLHPQIQDAINVESIGDGAVMTRLWLDNVTTTELGFVPVDPSGGQSITISNQTLDFSAGQYLFYTDFNYPQLIQLNSSTVLNPGSQALVSQHPDQTTSLSFLSYTDKLLAGAWRFLTYFGRDSMISALLLSPVLSQGEGGAMEAVISAVLERLNRTDGSVCHEETIGDYATYLNEQANISSTAPGCSYVMIDSDYYLPLVMDRYFLQSENGSHRATPFFEIQAGSFSSANRNLTYGDLALINAEKLMSIAGIFAAEGNQTIDNLAHIRSDQIVGEWRDSTYGIGGGRIPYDVNTALMPAALRSIAALARAGVYHNKYDWGTLADTYAQVWEDETLQFFQVIIPANEARSRLGSYVQAAGFAGPNQTDLIDDAVIFHALSLDGYNNLSQVQVMNTDDCFRLFLVNGTNQTQLTAFLNQTSNNVMRTFPAGLLTSVGMLVANPAYGLQPEYASNWTTSAYHGTVVWSWPQAMMARGLELQLDRCNNAVAPDFCNDKVVYMNVLNAYNTLWNIIEANTVNLSTEVWSWIYENGDFQFTPLGALPPPPGTSATGMYAAFTRLALH